jgi:GT2 family glycosyltransferase
MDAAKRFAINLVTWNSARHLPAFFQSLDAQTFRDFTVTVVDNASTDGTLAWLGEHRPNETVLRNFRNQGFARAHNQGIALALSRWQGCDLSERFIFLLNPDTVLDATCMARLASFMLAHPETDIAGPKLLRAVRTVDEDGDEEEIERTTLIDSAGISMAKSRRAEDRGAGTAFANARAAGREDDGRYDRGEPFGISGAAMIMRASAAERLRLGENEVLDEDFFAYKEDVDVCWRARLFGMRIALIPHAVAWHCRTAKKPDISGTKGLFRGQNERSAAVNRLSRRNQIWMEWKNDDTVSRILHLPWRLPELALRFAALVIFPSHLRAYAQAWLGRGRMRAKRRMIMERRKATPAEMRKWFV